MNHPKYKYQKQSFNEEAKISNHFPSLKDQIFSPGDDDINQKTIQKNSLNNFKILDDDDDIIFNKLNFKYMLKRNPFSLCEQETKLKINTNLLEERKTKKKYLILDLDETLVHSSFKPFNINNCLIDPDIFLNINYNSKLYEVFVLMRPFVNEFLKEMNKLYHIIIFTASIQEYADPLLDQIDTEKVIKNRLFREDCCLNDDRKYVKDLKVIKHNLGNVILVDNNPVSYSYNKSNGIPIKTWHFDKTDKELLKLIPLLSFLSGVNDVRDYIPKFVENNEINFSNVNLLINNLNNEKEQNKYLRPRAKSQKDCLIKNRNDNSTLNRIPKKATISINDCNNNAVNYSKNYSYNEMNIKDSQKRQNNHKNYNNYCTIKRNNYNKLENNINNNNMNTYLSLSNYINYNSVNYKKMNSFNVNESIRNRIFREVEEKKNEKVNLYNDFSLNLRNNDNFSSQYSLTMNQQHDENIYISNFNNEMKNINNNNNNYNNKNQNNLYNKANDNNNNNNLYNNVFAQSSSQIKYDVILRTPNKQNNTNTFLQNKKNQFTLMNSTISNNKYFKLPDNNNININSQKNFILNNNYNKNTINYNNYENTNNGKNTLNTNNQYFRNPNLKMSRSESSENLSNTNNNINNINYNNALPLEKNVSNKQYNFNYKEDFDYNINEDTRTKSFNNIKTINAEINDENKNQLNNYRDYYNNTEYDFYQQNNKINFYELQEQSQRQNGKNIDNYNKNDESFKRLTSPYKISKETNYYIKRKLKLKNDELNKIKDQNNNELLQTANGGIDNIDYTNNNYYTNQRFNANNYYGNNNDFYNSNSCNNYYN